MGYSPLNHTAPLFKPTDGSEPTGWAQVLGPPSLPSLPGTNISGTLLVPPTLPFAHSALSPRDTFALSLVSPCCTPILPDLSCLCLPPSPNGLPFPPGTTDTIFHVGRQ